MIRKTSTMVDGINWETYDSQYGVNPDNNFNQTVSLFARLSELDEYSIKVIHHEPTDKLYSSLVQSMWRGQILKVWIDTWIPAIFKLPAIYDPYKMQIIKAELGLAPLFGSVDSVIEMHNSGQLDQNRFAQLEPSWAMFTDLPLEYAKAVVNDKADKSFFESIVNEFLQTFADKDYVKAHRLFTSNNWLSQVMNENNYADLVVCFGVYKSEMNEKGYSLLFDGVSSIDELLGKYYRLKNA